MNQSASVSTVALANRLARPNLRAIPFDDPFFDWNVYLIKQKNAKLSKEARAFESLLLKHRNEMTGPGAAGGSAFNIRLHAPKNREYTIAPVCAILRLMKHIRKPRIG